MALNADQPCGKPLKNDLPDWAAMDRQCAARSTQKFRPLYDRLYAQLAAWRQGKPTILRTINRYHDFIGFEDAHLHPGPGTADSRFRRPLEQDDLREGQSPRLRLR
jgi:hypothetical protein